MTSGGSSRCVDNFLYQYIGHTVFAEEEGGREAIAIEKDAGEEAIGRA